jgi:hypothetical protein
MPKISCLVDYEGEEISHAQVFENCWVAAKKAQAAQTHFENEAKSKGMKTKLKGDDRVYGKNKKRPLKIVSEIEGGEAATADVFKKVEVTK